MNFSKKKIQLYLEILIHIILWTILPISSLLRNDGDLFIGLTNMKDGSIYVALFFGYIFNTTIFYGTALWLAPKYLSKGQYLKFVLWLLVLFMGVSGLEYLQDEIVIDLFNLSDSVFDGVSHTIQIGGPALFTNSALVIFALLYRFSRDWVKNELLNRKLNEEKLETELKFLKSQVNPHFLFNTLNNLYGMALKEKVPIMADNINKLSDIMRYMLYESNAEKVPLNKEIDYIKNFIEIQKLRFSSEDDIDISFDINGDIEHKEIAPMLLIPFVENAFKHGIDLHQKSQLTIGLELASTGLTFDVKNTNYRSNKMDRSDEKGIGLENVKRRLTLLYPGQNLLSIKDENEYFQVHLELPI